MNDDSEFSWPEDPAECAALARSMLIQESVNVARYWSGFGRDLLIHPQPEEPYIRPGSEVAKRERAYRETFATLNEAQRAKVIELLNQCVEGAVFSTLCALDQFPYGEAEIFVRDGVCGAGTRSFRIDTDVALHDDFCAAMLSNGSSSERPEP